MDRIRVVIADSDWTRARLVKYGLENRDIEVVEVSHGLDCLKILCQQGGDFVILDADLPDFNGWGVLSLLRLTPSFRRLPIILFSDGTPEPALLRQLSPGEYVLKPFELRNLLVAARRLIEEKRRPSQQPATGTHHGYGEGD